jgi:hypothetical protein
MALLEVEEALQRLEMLHLLLMLVVMGEQEQHLPFLVPVLLMLVEEAVAEERYLQDLEPLVLVGLVEAVLVLLETTTPQQAAQILVEVVAVLGIF